MTNGSQPQGKPGLSRALLAAAIVLLALLAATFASARLALAATGSVTLGSHGNVSYPTSWNSTREYFDTATGNAVYCVNPQLAGNPGGTYGKQEVTGNSSYTAAQIANALYVSYGAPGFDASLWPATNWNGNAMGASDYVVASHILLADMYQGDYNVAMSGSTEAFREWAKQILSYGSDQDNVEGKVARGETPAAPAGFHAFTLNPGNPDGMQSYLGFDYASISLTKASANTSITDGNGCYSLAGAKYGVYADKEATQSTGYSLVTDESGNATLSSDGGTGGALDPGTYYVKEIAPSKGYFLDTSVYTVEVSSGVARLDVQEQPGNDPSWALVQKVDAEGNPGAIGAATLSGAQFTVKYYDNTDGDVSGDAIRTWIFQTNKNGFVVYGDPDYYVSGDPMYTDASGNVVMPVGTYAIQETKAPAGYAISDSAIHVATVTLDGTGAVTWANKDGWNNHAAVTASGRGVADQALRQDLRFTKKDASTMETMPNTAFLLIANSDADGDGAHEAHVVVTDENGSLDTSAFSNDQRTNANDAALSGATSTTDEAGRIVCDLSGATIDESKLSGASGVWFTGRTDNTTSAQEGLASLPYDTYTVQELPTSANKGRGLVTFTVHVTPSAASRQGKVINMGTVDDPPISIRTTALGKDTGTHETLASATTTVEDTVGYEGLITGKKYVVTGYLHLRGTDGTDEGILLKDGTSVSESDLTDSMDPVTASTTFTPTTSSGTVVLDFTFDATKLGGRTVVAFESLSQDGKSVAAHADIADDDQSVTVPKIGSSATVDGSKSVDAGTVTVTDTISYEGLAPGSTYTATGHMVDSKGKRISDDVSVQFTPKKSSGTMDVRMEGIDASDLGGKTMVAYERVTDASGHVVAKHEDLSDESQTISVNQPKTSPSTSTTKTASKAETMPQTGVDGALAIALVALGAAVVGYGAYRFRKSRAHRK